MSRNENEDNINSTIRIKKSTREMLAAMGKKSDTYDDIIRRILKELERLKEKG
jgi:hypothetical protein